MLGIRTTFRQPPMEVLALIGMIYMQGLLEQAQQSTNAMFYKIFGNAVFNATKSRNRFKFLIAYISLDDHIPRFTTWQHDRFAAFRKMFEEFNKNCGKFLVRNDYLRRMKLFILRKRKLVSNNSIRATQPSMECFINQ